VKENGKIFGAGLGVHSRAVEIVEVLTGERKESDDGRLEFSPPLEPEVADMLADITNINGLQPILPR
jgi:hypothetical protein